MSHPLHPQNCPFTCAGSGHPVTYDSNLSPHPKQHLDRFRRFCTAHSRVTLYYTMGRLSPSKLLFIWEILTPSKTQFLEPTWVYNPNSISIGSAVFAELTIMTDRPRYSICNNRPVSMYVVLQCGLKITKILKIESKQYRSWSDRSLANTELGSHISQHRHYPVGALCQAEQLSVKSQ